jgi:hypothetical protein
MWVKTPETDFLEDSMRAMAAAWWDVPVRQVFLRRVNGNCVGVVISHQFIEALRWEWYGKTEEFDVGTEGILRAARDAFLEDLRQKLLALQAALDVGSRDKNPLPNPSTDTNPARE